MTTALAGFEAFIARETLALEIHGGAEAPDDSGASYEAVMEDEIDGNPVRLSLSRAE